MDMTVLRDVLHCTDKSSGGSAEYARGLIVGVVSTLVVCGDDYNVALARVKRNMPSNPHDCFPESWK